MNKKLQVFVSSTYTDLIEERQAAVEAILDAGHIPAGMELFKAGKSQMKTIRKWIDDSDVYMLILGGRYGSIETESGFSYTELEYHYALSKNMPVFAIVLNSRFLFRKAAAMDKDSVFEKENNDKYEKFKSLVESNVVKFAANVENIVSIIHSHLNSILSDTDYELTGWVRCIPEKDISQLLKENSSLKEENELLTKQLKELKNNTCERLGNYSFDELITIFKNKIFTMEGNLSKVRKNDQISALDFFILYYNFFTTGVSSRNWLSNDHLYIYNLYAPYYASFQLLEKKHQGNSKYETFMISPIGSAFYSMLESKGITDTLKSSPFH